MAAEAAAKTTTGAAPSAVPPILTAPSGPERGP
jgi:hypothetical protein